MAVQTIKINKDDSHFVNSIFETFMHDADEKPSASHLQTLLTDDRTYVFVALSDNAVIGYALAYRFPSLYAAESLAYLYDIEVLKTHRRKGAGRQLIQTMLTHLKADGVGELWLGTATDNTEGQGLFAGTGGLRSGETFNDFTYEL